MAKPPIVCHFLVPCLAVQWDGPAGPSTTRTLEGVGYTYRTDTPSGFPYETELWLCTRLAHSRRREFTRDLHLTLVWHDDPQRRSLVWRRRFQTVTFRPGTPVRDIARNVPLTFEGPGRYEFRLWHKVRGKWDRKAKMRILARAHIRMEG
jgi:hypothetical protein